MVHQHDSHHGFGNRHGADTYTRVVATFGDHLYLLAFTVNGAPRNGNARGRFECDMRNHRLPAADPTQNAACVIAFETLWGNFVTVLAATFSDHGKTITNLYAFHRIDAHQRMG